MSHEKQLIKESNIWGVQFLLTALAAVPFYYGETIRVCHLGAMQFSNNLTELNGLLNKFGHNLNNNLAYDFIYILAYTALFYISYRVVALSTKASISVWIGALCLLPGVSDLVENFMLYKISTNSEESWLFCAFWIAVRAKFSLVIPFVVLNFGILIYYLIRLYDAIVKSK